MSAQKSRHARSSTELQCLEVIRSSASNQEHSWIQPQITRKLNNPNFRGLHGKVKILQRNANLDGTSVTVGPPPEQVGSSALLCWKLCDELHLLAGHTLGCAEEDKAARSLWGIAGTRSECCKPLRFVDDCLCIYLARTKVRGADQQGKRASH